MVCGTWFEWKKKVTTQKLFCHSLNTKTDPSAPNFFALCNSLRWMDVFLFTFLLLQQVFLPLGHSKNCHQDFFNYFHQKKKFEKEHGESFYEFLTKPAMTVF